MGSTERRAREREEMRGKILDAARNLFASEGYDAVTLRKVADSIEYCPATIYKYFKDKEEMVRALVEDDIAMTMEAFLPSLEHQAPLDRLRGICTTFLKMGLEQPNHYRLMYMTPLLPGHDPVFVNKRSDPQTDSYGLSLSIVQQCIDAKVFRPELTDAHLITQTFWAGVHGVISLHIACGNIPVYEWRPVFERGVFMLELMISGMLRTPSAALPAVSSTPESAAATPA